MHFHVIKSFPLKILFTRELHYIMVRVENTVAGKPVPSIQKHLNISQCFVHHAVGGKFLSAETDLQNECLPKSEAS